MLISTEKKSAKKTIAFFFASFLITQEMLYILEYSWFMEAVIKLLTLCFKLSTKHHMHDKSEILKRLQINKNTIVYISPTQ